MSFLRAWLVRLGAHLRIGRRRNDIDEELQSAVDLHIDDCLSRGMTDADARRSAAVAFGPRQAIREAAYDQHSIPFIALLSTAFRQSMTSLIRHPGFCATAIAMLGIGVGLTAGLGATADALLLRPPAGLDAPDRLVRINVARNYVQFEALAEQSQTMEVTGTSRRTLSMGRGGDAGPLETACVTRAFFEVMGTTMAAGHTFAASDHLSTLAPPIVLAHHIWQRAFSGNSAAIGTTTWVAGRQYVIVGVAAPGFRGLELAAVDAWVLLPSSPVECSISGVSLLASSQGSWLTVLGRMREGIGLPAADAEARTIAQTWSTSGRPIESAVTPALEARATAGIRDRRLSLWVASGAVLVLLIAAANIGSLLAVRAVERRRELTVRTQLGASRVAVRFQLLLENALLTGAAGMLAWVVAGWTGSVAARFLPAIAYDPWSDARVLGILATFLGVAGMISTIAPLVQTSAGATTQPQSGRWSPGRARAWRFILVAQMTFAMVLSTGAVLFAMSLTRVKADVGYDLRGVIVASVDLARAGIRRQREQQEIFAAIVDRLREDPEVTSVALSSQAPLGLSQFYAVTPGGAKGAGPDRPSFSIVDVTPGYFSTIGTRILAGRDFTPDEVRSGASVALVDAALAGALWPHTEIAGRCMDLIPGRPCTTIVGITESRRVGSLRQTNLEAFFPLRMDGSTVPQAILVRPENPDRDALTRIATAVRTAAPNLPYVSVRLLEDVAGDHARSWRLGTWLFGLFAGCGLLFAAAGLYAALSFAVRQRANEIGVRMALGADSGAITRLVLGHGARIVAIGWILGVCAVVVFADGVNHLLFGVTATDIPVIAASSIALVVTGLTACLWPAWRAARLDPTVVLRTE